MKKTILILLVILISGALFATPEIGIPYMNKPTIDGKIDVNEWHGASRVTGFHLLGGKSLEPNKSVVYVGYDSDNFYLAYRFYGPSKPKGVDKGKAGAYWEDDTLEFFFNADEKEALYYQFLLNCSGGYAVFGYNTTGENVNGVGGKAVDLDALYKTYISPAYSDLVPPADALWWEGEISVSWKSLKFSPQAGDRGFLFLTRDNVSPEYYNSDYGYAESTFHEKDKYSTIHFLKDTAVARMDIDSYDKFEIFNPTGEEKVVNIKSSVVIDGEVQKTFEDKVKIPKGSVVDYSLNDEFPKSIFKLITEIVDDKGFLLTKAESDIFNVDLFSYNYDREKDKIIVNFNFTGAPVKENPYVDMRLMKDSDMLVGFMINVTEDKRFRTFEIDMSPYPKGNYTLFCKGVVNITETITK